MQGAQEWKNHTLTMGIDGQGVEGYDLWWNQIAVDKLTVTELYELTGYESADGVHSNDLFTQRALKILNNASVDQPFTLTVAFQEPHAPFIEPPAHRNIEANYDCDLVNSTDERIAYCKMVCLLDDSVRQIIEKLVELEL